MSASYGWASQAKADDGFFSFHDPPYACPQSLRHPGINRARFAIVGH
jgi:hypothetical protein